MYNDTIYVIVYFCVTLYIIGYGRLTLWMTRHNYCKLKQTAQKELLIIFAASTCTAPCLVQMLYSSIRAVNIVLHQMYGKTCANLVTLRRFASHCDFQNMACLHISD